MAFVAANYRVLVEESMFRHLSDRLDPAIKKKVPPTALKEVLSCLSDWAYIERSRWLAEASGASPREAEDHAQRLRERLKPDGKGTTFLDELDEIR